MSVRIEVLPDGTILKKYSPMRGVPLGCLCHLTMGNLAVTVRAYYITLINFLQQSGDTAFSTASTATNLKALLCWITVMKVQAYRLCFRTILALKIRCFFVVPEPTPDSLPLFVVVPFDFGFVSRIGSTLSALSPLGIYSVFVFAVAAEGR